MLYPHIKKEWQKNSNLHHKNVLPIKCMCLRQLTAHVYAYGIVLF